MSEKSTNARKFKKRISETLVKDLKDYLKATATSRIQKFNSSIAFSFSRDLDCKKDLYGEEMSLILVWGPLGQIYFKIFFTMDDAKHIAAKSLGKQVEEIDHAMAFSTMRELSNFQGGYLRGVLEDFQTLSGISLPFLLKAKDQTILKNISSEETQSVSWLLNVDERNLAICVEFNISNPQRLAEVLPGLQAIVELDAEKKAEDEGDLEFL